MHRIRRGLMAAAVAGALVAGAPVNASAQPTPSPPGATEQSEPPGYGGHPDLSGVLHGEGTVQTDRGKVRVAVQQGMASRVTDTSLTVRSQDGYTRTWTVGQDTKVMSKRNGLQSAPVAAGSKVFVGGTLQGAGATATATARFVLLDDQGGASSAPPAEPSPAG